MLPGQKSALAFLWGRAVELKTEVHHAHEERYKTLGKKKGGLNKVTSCTSSLVILPSTLVSTLILGPRTAAAEEAYQESAGGKAKRSARASGIGTDRSIDRFVTLLGIRGKKGENGGRGKKSLARQYMSKKIWSRASKL